jgi:hypothetical protein
MPYISTLKGGALGKCSVVRVLLRWDHRTCHAEALAAELVEEQLEY